ncbi:hypothetical protein [Parafilimonas sp.]|uniref:hypothetical protein n=1 Tax=Parafilimonas sp. TaxID=1969739 RepID=UPI0039E5B008
MWLQEYFITEGLLPLLETLNKYGSFKKYYDSESAQANIQKLKEEIKKFELEEKTLKEKSIELNSQLQAIENKSSEVKLQIKEIKKKIQELELQLK